MKLKTVNTQRTKYFLAPLQFASQKQDFRGLVFTIFYVIHLNPLPSSINSILQIFHALQLLLFVNSLHKYALNIFTDNHVRILCRLFKTGKSLAPAGFAQQCPQYSDALSCIKLQTCCSTSSARSRSPSASFWQYYRAPLLSAVSFIHSVLQYKITPWSLLVLHVSTFCRIYFFVTNGVNSTTSHLFYLNSASFY